MTPNHLLAAAAGVLLLGLSGIQLALVRPPAPAQLDTMVALLTAENAARPAKLSQIERDEAVRQCIVAFDTQENSGIRRFGDPEEIARSLAAFGRRSCECVVGRLANRTTTLEFVLAMAMQFSFAPRTDYAVFDVGSPGKRERILPHAAKLGVSTKQFDAAGIRAETAISVTGRLCMDTHGD